MASNAQRVLPGFQASLGFSAVYLTLLILLPLLACLLSVGSLSWNEFVAAIWSERARSAYALTFGASLVSGILDVFLGLMIAWVLVRYDFWGKKFLDSLVDLPFALPTAVAGLVYSNLYAGNGWLGQFLVPMGIEGAYSRLGIVLVLTFTGLPLVVRTVQPVIESLDGDVEEAAALLGATRWQTFTKVIFPAIFPALITGFALSFARALGEYGSVVFIAGNMPNQTEIAPVLIVQQLEEFKYAQATAIAVVLLAMSFTTLAAINGLEQWSKAGHA